MSVLLYDGACGFCAASVQWILRRDRRGTLSFAALEGEYGAGVRSRHADLAAVDSMVWVEPPAGRAPERVFMRSAAALRVARYLGGFWRVAALAAAVIPGPLRDAAYDFIARHRHDLHSFAGGGDRCLIPAAAVRARFLD